MTDFRTTAGSEAVQVDSLVVTAGITVGSSITGSSAITAATTVTATSNITALGLIVGLSSPTGTTGLGSTGNGTAVGNSGVTVVSSTGDIRNYILAAPVAGVEKIILGGTITNSTSPVNVIAATTTITFDNSGSVAVIAETTGMLYMVGLSATRWRVITKTTGVSFTTT